ncbi:MAG: hypothetical protein LM600_07260 [Thaumarchaeota archaeon]|nr:hypothetical protein [Nitrososphaerota archaeon]
MLRERKAPEKSKKAEAVKLITSSCGLEAELRRKKTRAEIAELTVMLKSIEGQLYLL